MPNCFLEEIDFNERQKEPYLITDLIQLGINPNTFLKEKLPTLKIDSEAKALAALYVAEGTAIGGAIIKKNLLKIKELKQLTFSFYGCYGNTLSAKWKCFVKAFNERCENEEFAQEVIDFTDKVFGFYESIILYFEQAFLCKSPQESVDNHTMFFKLKDISLSSNMLSLTWANLPEKVDIEQDIAKVNSLLETHNNCHVLLNFMQLGDNLSRPKKHMWEITKSFESIHKSKITKIGIAVPRKTTGKIMVKQMLDRIIEDQNIAVGFFETLQDCTLWSTK